MNHRQWISAVVLACVASGCAPVTRTTTTRHADADRAVQHGLASYYGEAFHQRSTASGVPFDMNAMVAAHPTYPFGTVVRVTNLQNGRSAQMRIVDRGPAAAPQAGGVIIDVSRRVARVLDFIQAGRTRVRVDVVR